MQELLTVAVIEPLKEEKRKKHIAKHNCKKTNVKKVEKLQEDVDKIDKKLKHLRNLKGK